MKALLPSLKEKKRYILFRVVGDAIDKRECSDAIMKACLRMMGELGVAKAGIIFLSETYKDNEGILRVDSKYVNEVKLALATIQEISGKTVSVDAVKVSGVINRLK